MKARADDGHRQLPSPLVSGVDESITGMWMSRVKDRPGPIEA
jgi:hypothetical protein